MDAHIPMWQADLVDPGRRVEIMAGARRIPAFGLAFLLVGLTAAPAAAQLSSTIGFADTEPLNITIGAVGTVEIHNNMARPSSVKLMFSPDHLVTFVKAENTLPEGGSLFVELTGRNAGTGSLVAIDQSDTTKPVIRRKVTVLSQGPAQPAATDLTSAVEVGWDQASATIGTVAAASAAPCPAVSQPNTGIAVSGSDVVHLRATCIDDGGRAVYDVRADGLDPLQTGVYQGTLRIGATDVAVEFSRGAPLWLAFGCLLLGIIVITLAKRGAEALTLVTGFRRRIDDLERPCLPHLSWTNTVREQFLQTTGDLDAARRDAAREWLRLSPLRCLVIPAAAQAKTESARADVAAVADAVREWNSRAKSEGTTLAKSSRTLPEKLAARAKVILTGSPDAMWEPHKPDQPRPAQRVGMPGLAAVLNEAHALNTVALLARRLDALEEFVTAAPSKTGDPYHDEPVQQIHTRGQLSILALRAELNRCVDAAELLADGFTQRIEAAAALAGQLPSSTVEEARAATRLSQLEPPPEGRTTSAVSWAHGPVPLTPRDLLVLVAALLVTITVVLVDFHVGAPWGTGWDLFTATLTGMAGSVAMLLSAGALAKSRERKKP